MAREGVLVFAANFTAIDFETASRRSDSACQLAAVVVRNGKITAESKWMIRPEPCYFSPANIEIHGITPRCVRDAQTFGQLWPEIANSLDSDVLVAHNASFDIGVLLSCLAAHGHPASDIEFTCTRAIARRTWPHLPRFGLKPLASWLGIRFQHHDALEDSIACAKILLAAGIDRNASSLADLEKQLRIGRGRAGAWGFRGPGQTKRASSRQTKQRQPKCDSQPALPFLFPDQVQSADRVRSSSIAYAVSSRVAPVTEPTIDLQRLLIRADFIRPLSGKQVVISGRLRTLDAHQASELATRSGGTCQQVIDEATDYLILGDLQSKLIESEHHKMVAQLRDRGGPVQIVTEEEFLAMVISSPKDAHTPSSQGH
jgi:DNA polymerase III subunit epsilon